MLIYYFEVSTSQETFEGSVSKSFLFLYWNKNTTYYVFNINVTSDILSSIFFTLQLLPFSELKFDSLPFLCLLFMQTKIVMNIHIEIAIKTKQ